MAKLMYFRNHDHEGVPTHFGGRTIAWEFPEEGIIRIACAICSRNDRFNRKIGRMIALNRLAAGACIEQEIAPENCHGQALTTILAEIAAEQFDEENVRCH